MYFHFSSGPIDTMLTRKWWWLSCWCFVASATNETETLVKSIWETAPKSSFCPPPPTCVPRFEYLLCDMIGLLKYEYDWPSQSLICQSRWVKIQNTLLVICWVGWGQRTKISALLRRPLLGKVYLRLLGKVYLRLQGRLVLVQGLWILGLG